MAKSVGVILGLGVTGAGAQTSGTGFLVTSAGHVVTNEHVVRGCGTLSVSFGAVMRPATILASDAQTDLAVLWAPGTGATPLPVRAEAAVLGEAIIVFGFPLAGTLSREGVLSVGIVAATAGFRDDRRFMQISAPVQPGNSGGPVLDNRGQVMGVVNSKLDAITALARTGDIPQNVNFAVATATLRQMLAAQAVALPPAARPSAPMSTVDIAAAARAGSLQVRCTPAARPSSRESLAHIPDDVFIPIDPPTPPPARRRAEAAASKPPQPVAPAPPVPSPPFTPRTGTVPAVADPAHRNPGPRYPEEARLRGVTGRVGLEISVTPEGRVSAVVVRQSSGDATLDLAAERAAADWRFLPALQDGIPVNGTIRTSVNFRLN